MCAAPGRRDPLRHDQHTHRSRAATVAEIYAAFGRGDVPAILDQLADDVAWEDWPANDAQRAGVRHLLPRRGATAACGVLHGDRRLDRARLRRARHHRRRASGRGRGPRRVRPARRRPVRRRGAAPVDVRRRGASPGSATTSTPPSTSAPTAARTPRPPEASRHFRHAVSERFPARRVLVSSTSTWRTATADRGSGVGDPDSGGATRPARSGAAGCAPSVRICDSPCRERRLTVPGLTTRRVRIDDSPCPD